MDQQPIVGPNVQTVYICFMFTRHFFIEKFYESFAPGGLVPIYTKGGPSPTVHLKGGF